MTVFSVVWKWLDDIGISHTPDLNQRKRIRLLNRVVFFSTAIVFIQFFNFWWHGFGYAMLVNAISVLAFIGCFVLNAAGANTLAIAFYIGIAFLTVIHHHFGFGYASGFWLFLLNLTQGSFILFANMKLQGRLVLCLLLAAGASTLIIMSSGAAALYPGVTANPTEHFFFGNLVRSLILFVLTAYYLIYENNRTEVELVISANKATEAADAKTFFLSNVSHELRTPMNAIKGFSDILYDLTNSIDDEAKQLEFKAHLGQIRISAANLTSIIDDLLDFTRIGAGRISFRSKDFDLSELVHNAMQTAEFHSHKGKGIETRLTLSPDLPQLLKGDPSRLSQILLNLVGNAMKFTHKGHVELRIFVREETPTAARLCFEVEDTGIGIPGEKLPFLFDSLSPVSRETAIRYGGTGLGLAISKHLVEMQGGSISVMSSAGKGALFTVDLWFEKGENAATRENRARRDLKGARILVAEDNDVNQILVRTLLESWNADIHIVENGLKALGEAQSNRYDLILMDLQMPFMDGIEACENIRMLDDKEKSSVPIIALTADVLSETRKKVFTVGMNDIITKPINQADLYAALKRGLNFAE